MVIFFKHREQIWDYNGNVVIDILKLLTTLLITISKLFRNYNVRFQFRKVSKMVISWLGEWCNSLIFKIVLKFWKTINLERRCIGSKPVKTVYIYYNFSRVCSLTKMASETVKISIIFTLLWLLFILVCITFTWSKFCGAFIRFRLIKETRLD